MLTLLAGLDATLNVVKTIVGIGGLIFVHELGHFLVGRWCGVRAEVFSIGFGHAIFKWKPGDTEYRVAWIPLGGYVKFLGTEPDDQGTHAPDSFHSATYPRKAAIMLAGVAMNVLAAFVLFVWTFSAGVELPAPVVGDVTPGYPAWEYGIQPGDEIVTIDGKQIIEFADVIQDVVLADAVDVQIRRDGELLPVLHVPTRVVDGLPRLGMSGSFELLETVQVEPDSPAALAGFRDGDRLVAFDGTPCATPHAALVAWAATGSGTFTVERDGETLDIPLNGPTETRYRIGVAPDHAEIGAVRLGGPAAAAGVRGGDRPLTVDGEPVATVGLLQERLADAERPAKVVTFARDGGTLDIDVSADPAAFGASLAGGGAGLVVRPYFAGAGEQPGPAEAAGIVAGSTIIAADGAEVEGLADLQEVVGRAGEKQRPISLRWRTPDGEERTADVVPSATQVVTDLPGLVTQVEKTRLVKETNVVAAVALGLERTDRFVKRILSTLGSLVTGKVSATNLSGPLAIAQATYSQAEASLGRYLLFLGFISMNLAVLNLLPIPMLDGGQLAMLTAERVRGRPLPVRLQEGLQWAGLIMLLALMLFVVANDIRNL